MRQQRSAASSAALLGLSAQIQNQNLANQALAQERFLAMRPRTCMVVGNMITCQ
jgi:hypothetical protein